MGVVNGTVVFKNPRVPEVDPVEVEALADSGALHLFIPEHVKIHLRLEAIDCKEVTLADGSRKVVQYVGPIELHFKNRVGFAGPWSWVTKVLLGAIPIEDIEFEVEQPVALGRLLTTRRKKDHVDAYDCLVRLPEVSGEFERIQS